MAGRVRHAAGPADEAAVTAALVEEGLDDVHAYDDSAAAQYAAHVHAFDKVLHCIGGGIVFTTADGELALTPGDRLDLDRGTDHAAVVGPTGVRLVEGHRH